MRRSARRVAVCLRQHHLERGLRRLFRHDLVKIAVAVLDRLVERDVVELAVVGLRPQVRVCAGQRPSKASNIVMQSQPGRSNEVLDNRQLP